jgi:hypothetical protein
VSLPTCKCRRSRPLTGQADDRGVTSITPQLLVPFAADLAEPSERGRVVGIVMSGLLIGILSVKDLLHPPRGPQPNEHGIHGHLFRGRCCGLLGGSVGLGSGWLGRGLPRGTGNDRGGPTHLRRHIGGATESRRSLLRDLGLEQTVRPEGRPRKASRSTTSFSSFSMSLDILAATLFHSSGRCVKDRSIRSSIACWTPNRARRRC